MIKEFIQYILENITVEAIAVVVSVIVFFLGLQHQKKLDTVNRLTTLRMKYINMSDAKTKQKHNYLRELEFFATGINTHVYSYGIVKRMSRARLISQYNNWMRNFIEDMRKDKNNKNAYKECEIMIEKLKISQEYNPLKKLKAYIEFKIQKLDKEKKIIGILSRYWIIMGLIFTLMVKIKYSQVPLNGYLNDIEFCRIILLRPKENTIYFEILTLLDAIVTSFAASLVFYGLNVVLPSKGKNKSMQRAIQCIITEILNEIKTPHTICMNFYNSQSSFDISIADKKDIDNFFQTVDYYKNVYYYNDKWITGIEVVHMSIQKIESYIGDLYRIYMDVLSSEELDVLEKLKNSMYIKEFERGYQHLKSRNSVSIPADILEEKYKNKTEGV